jgi:hypothetical protein
VLRQFRPAGAFVVAAAASAAAASSALGHPCAESSPPSRELVWQPPRSWWGGGSPTWFSLTTRPQLNIQQPSVVEINRINKSDDDVKTVVMREVDWGK